MEMVDIEHVKVDGNYSDIEEDKNSVPIQILETSEQICEETIPHFVDVTKYLELETEDFIGEQNPQESQNCVKPELDKDTIKPELYYDKVDNKRYVDNPEKVSQSAVDEKNKDVVDCGNDYVSSISSAKAENEAEPSIKKDIDKIDPGAKKLEQLINSELCRINVEQHQSSGQIRQNTVDAIKITSVTNSFTVTDSFISQCPSIVEDSSQNEMSTDTVNNNLTNSTCKRKRPVIHRKCKEDINRNEKTRAYMPRYFMKYRSKGDYNQKQITLNCQNCEYTTGNRSNYKNHLLIHGEERSYRCPFCPYRSKQSAGLRAHYKVHSIEKPYACSFCVYKSKRKQNLIQHLKIHAKDKPFRCEECPYQGSTKQLLQSHTLYHITRKQTKRFNDRVNDGIFECLLCNRTFTNEDDLSHHFESHAYENVVSSSQEIGILNKETQKKLERANIAFKCSLCDFITLRKCAYRNHVKSHNKSSKIRSVSDYQINYSESQLANSENSNNKLNGVSHDLNVNSKHFENVEIPDTLNESFNDGIEEADINNLSPRVTSTLSFKCPYCDYICDMGEILKVHICNHSNEELQISVANSSSHNNYHNGSSERLPNTMDKDDSIYDFNSSQEPESTPYFSLKDKLNIFRNMKSKSSFIDNLESKQLASPRNYDCEGININRKSSYATYNSNQSEYFDRDRGQTSNEEIEPLYKRLKLDSNEFIDPTQQSYGIINEGLSSFEATKEEISYERVDVSDGAMDDDDNDNILMSSEYWPNEEERESFLEGNNSGEENILQMPFLPVQSPVNDEEPMMTNESYRILLHVLENTNIDYKTVQEFGSLRNDTMQNGLKLQSTHDSTASGPSDIQNTSSACDDSHRKNLDTGPVEESEVYNSENVNDQIYVENVNLNNLNLWKSGDTRSPQTPTCLNTEIRCPKNDHYYNETLPKVLNGKNCDKNVSTNQEKYPQNNYSPKRVNDEIYNKDDTLRCLNKLIESNVSHLSYKKETNEDKSELNNRLSESDLLDNLDPDLMVLSERLKVEKLNKDTLIMETKKFVCKKCDLTFVRKSSLSNHNRIHSPKIYRCLECPFKTKVRREYINHLRVHTRNLNFRCVQCDFVTKRKCSLISHSRAHKMMYACAHCGFECHLFRDLESHSIQHDNNLSIKCLCCDFTTSKHKTLKYHMKKHTNNPLYICSECGFGFQTEEEFHEHVKVHKGLDGESHSSGSVEIL